MWIPKKEWKEMKERVAKIENNQNQLLHINVNSKEVSKQISEAIQRRHATTHDIAGLR